MEIIGEYLNYLELSRGLSNNSLRLYKRDLLDFDTFTKKVLLRNRELQIYDIKNLNPEELDSYKKWILAAGRSTASVNRKLTALHGLWEWLRDQGEVARDPFTQIIRDSQFRNKQHSSLSQEQMNKLLDYPEHDLRTRLVLEMLYATGMRISELADLTLTDIDLENQLITIARSRRYKERIIPFNKLLLEYLEKYTEEHKLSENDHLLFTQEKTRLSEREIFRIIREAGQRAGLDEELSSSIIRNSFLKHMKERGAHDILLQDLTGQKNLSY